MARKEPAFTIGVEEEYLFVDKETRGLVVDPPETLMDEAKEACGAPGDAGVGCARRSKSAPRSVTTSRKRTEDLARLRRNVIEASPVVTALHRSPRRRTVLAGAIGRTHAQGTLRCAHAPRCRARQGGS